MPMQQQKKYDPFLIFQKLINFSMGLLWTKPIYSPNPAKHYQKIIADLRNQYNNELLPIPMHARLFVCYTGVKPIKNIVETSKKESEKDKCDMVFIWDCDDITMLSSYIIAAVAKEFPEYASTIVWLNDMVQNLLSSVNFIDPDELIEKDVQNIEDVVGDGSKYDNLRQFYDEIREISEKEHSIISLELPDKIGIIDERNFEFCFASATYQTLLLQRWKRANKCLELIIKRSGESKNKKYTNVLLSDNGIVVGAAQILVAKLTSAIPIENIYSTAKTSKETIIKRIQQKFGGKCIYVTSSPSNIRIAEKLQITAWHIDDFDSLNVLHDFLRDFLLSL